jgi:biotin carboxyl carrier protein
MPFSETGETDMRRRIDLLDNHYMVTIFNKTEEKHMTVDTEGPWPVAITETTDRGFLVQAGENRVQMQMAVKGQMAYIHAFDQTFALGIINPVEQAAQESGGSSNAIFAPMPGMVVEIMTLAGNRVVKNQSVMTIESMKILTVLTAPRDGEIVEVHVNPGDSFDKNAVLITLSKKES